MLGRRRRSEELPDQRFLHVELILSVANLQQSLNDHPAFTGGKALSARGSVLGRENAHPNLFHISIRRPKIDKGRNVIGTMSHRTCHSAMHRYVMAFDVSQDSIVSRRLAPKIVFRLQSVDRNGHLQIPKLGPGSWNRTESAGNNLHVSALRQLGQKNIKFPIANERIATHNGKVQRVVLFHELADLPDKFFALEIVQAA